MGVACIGVQFNESTLTRTRYTMHSHTTSMCLVYIQHVLYIDNTGHCMLLQAPHPMYIYIYIYIYIYTGAIQSNAYTLRHLLALYIVIQILYTA